MRLLPPELTVPLLWAGQLALLQSDEWRAGCRWASWELPGREAGKQEGAEERPGIIDSFLWSFTH